MTCVKEAIKLYAAYTFLCIATQLQRISQNEAYKSNWSHPSRNLPAQTTQLVLIQCFASVKFELNYSKFNIRKMLKLCMRNSETYTWLCKHKKDGEHSSSIWDLQHFTMLAILK